MQSPAEASHVNRGAEYHKIQTVWLRDPATNNKRLLEGQWSRPEFEYLQDAEWVFTEKVDGTNCRVDWTGSAMVFNGKTDAAQLPMALVHELEKIFAVDALRAINESPFTLYGEGYGARIQSGGDYIQSGVSFILFDVWCGMWLMREDVEEIADKLRIGVVPILQYGPLHNAIEICRSDYPSAIAAGRRNIEGLVMRPRVELSNRRGERVITKIKRKDFAP